MGSPRYLVFYSYRGGVGRTLALCNVAARMAEAGDRVLVIDFDIEAPGASVLLGEGKAGERDGLLECLQFFRVDDCLPPLDSYVHLVHPGSAPLKLLPAGRLDDSYPKKVGMLDWVGDFSESAGIGERCFRALREAVDAIEPPLHYVLVDSRPGISPTGALALEFFAHEAVLVCGLNRQSLAGLRWASAMIANKPRVIHCILSPAPPRAEGYEEERDTVRKGLHADLIAELPFDEELLWRERLLVSPQDRTRPLALRYDELTDALRPPDDVHLLVKNALADLQTPGKATLANANLMRALHQDPNDVRVLRALAHVKFLSADHDAACDYAERAVDVAPDDSASWKIVDDLYELYKDESGKRRDRLEALYANHVGPSSDERRLLAWFSVCIRQANPAVESPDNAVSSVLSELRQRSAALTPPGLNWREFAVRLPIRPHAAETRADLRNWSTHCRTAGLHELDAVLKQIGDELKLYEDVSGVVDQFFRDGYGFLRSDDGEASIYFHRNDCVGFGTDSDHFIPKGEIAVFDLKESDEPNHPWRATRVRFPQRVPSPFHGWVRRFC